MTTVDLKNLRIQPFESVPINVTDQIESKKVVLVQTARIEII
jgi:hypothetical protein